MLSHMQFLNEWTNDYQDDEALFEINVQIRRISVFCIWINARNQYFRFGIVLLGFGLAWD